MKVRLGCMFMMRGPKKGMPGPSTCESSITSPLLMSAAPRSPFFGFFMWLPEPRSSPAPHFDGQRALSGGTFHCARAIAGAESSVASSSFFTWISSVEIFVKTLVIKGAGHLRELVAELALLRRDAVRVERLAR